ncbi:hypothetical protein BX266_5686 [Streptomyces sp. TLI_171]|nr:hypothetical protein BX266_5686 [Streptomyces sp. TLI_171]
MFAEVRPQPGWWGIVKERAAACWWQLLVLSALGALAEGCTELVLLPFHLPYQLRDALQVLIGTVTGTLVLAAGARVLGLGVGPLTALRVPPRRLAATAGWSLLLHVESLYALVHAVVAPDGPWAPEGPVVWTLLLALVYGAVVALVLPMTAFLENGGARGAWLVVHSGWATALRLLALALVTVFATQFLPGWAAVAMYRYQVYPAVGVMGLVQIPLTAAVLLLAYATYLRSPAAAPTPLPAAPSPYPTVDPAFPHSPAERKPVSAPLD